MNYYYEPVNINQWNIFDKVERVGHVEPMLAVKGMETGDVVLLHVGQQNKERESGVYAIGEIIRAPYILRNSPQDYCNNKNTVDVKIVRIDFDKPLITHEDTKGFVAQFRTVHRISEEKRTCVENAIIKSKKNFSDELSESDDITHGLNIEGNIKPSLTDEEKEIVEQLLFSIKNSEPNVTYKELSERLSFKPNPHYGLTKKLDHIGTLCYMMNLPFITFLVVKEDSKIPGEGCTVFYDRFGIDTKGKDTGELYKNEKEKIRNCSRWQELADYLGLDIKMPARGEVVYPDEVIQKTFHEGAQKRVEVNAYERDPLARRKCIDYYSHDSGRIKCQICGFDFGEFYGSEYDNLIQVHHVKPLSEIKRDYVVDPIKDLIPVCPNCHMVLHSNVGESIEKLKMRLKKKQRNEK